jgi:hypothetical protein
MDETTLLVDALELSISRQKHHLSQLLSNYLVFVMNSHSRRRSELQSRPTQIHQTNTTPAEDIQNRCQVELHNLRTLETHGLFTSLSKFRMCELETDPTTALWVCQIENETQDLLRKMFWTAFQEEMTEQLGILDKLMRRLQEARAEIFSRPVYDPPEPLEEIAEAEGGYSAA